MKDRDEKITVLTAYDYPTARILEEAGVDAILVGDSLGNVVLGYDNTIPVTMEDMVHHTGAVARAVEESLLISDMPFLSWQTGAEEGVRNAGRLVKEAGAEAVKVEGGRESAEEIEAILEAGIPVMGHLGLTPQRILQFGSYSPRGRTAEEAKKIIEDAEMLDDLGVFGIVLESVPGEVDRMVTKRVDVPTIGIGAGPHCDGQVLVLHDILGLTEFSPKFVKQYADIGSKMQEAVEEFRGEVKSGEFPALEHGYEMEEGELDELEDILGKDP